MAKITGIHIHRCDLPVVGPPYRMALAEVAALDTTLVEIVTDTGLVGYGETCPLGPVYQPAHAAGARAALAEIAPAMLGLDPLATGVAAARMEDALAGHLYAKAALDIALWDIAGKTTGRRLCDLLGGARNEPVPSYYAIGLGSPDDVARQVLEKQGEGYRRLQLKMGGRDIEEDIATARKAFEARRPGTRIALDANRGWTIRDAILLSQTCRDLPLVIEQPCASYEEMRALKPHLAHPLHLDESATDLAMVMRAIHDGTADGFGMKLTRVGGVSAMRAIRDVCQAAGRPITCDDSWGGDIVAAACAHLGATVAPRLFEGTWIAAPYIDGHYDRADGPTVADGSIRLPGGPGLGIVPGKTAWVLCESFG